MIRHEPMHIIFLSALVNVTKISVTSNVEKERFILVHGFGGFSP